MVYAQKSCEKNLINIIYIFKYTNVCTVNILMNNVFVLLLL